METTDHHREITLKFDVLESILHPSIQVLQLWLKIIKTRGGIIYYQLKVHIEMENEFHWTLSCSVSIEKMPSVKYRSSWIRKEISAYHGWAILTLQSCDQRFSSFPKMQGIQWLKVKFPADWGGGGDFIISEIAFHFLNLKSVKLEPPSKIQCPPQLKRKKAKSLKTVLAASLIFYVIYF